MVSSKINIAIVESSDIVRIGVEHIVDSSPELAITYSEASLPTAANVEINTLIISSAILAREGMQRIGKLFPSADIIALVYGYVPRAERALYSEVIEISDSPEVILELLHKGRISEDKSAQKADSGELSEREMEVVAAVARGLINKEIADSLNISIHTVMAHRKNIARKTGIRSISGLVVYAILNGLIEQSEVLK